MITELQDKMPEEANDIKLNLESVLSEGGAPGLSQNQIYGIALASAYATKNPRLIDGLATEAFGKLLPEELKAARTAAIIMAMNNVYYRAVHLAEDKDLESLPARLRMNSIARPGIPKNDFELYSIAVSAINGCGKCVSSHVHTVKAAGVSTEAVHSTIRIASVVNAAAQALSF